MKTRIFLLSAILVVTGFTCLILAYNKPNAKHNITTLELIGNSDATSTPEQTISEYILFSKENKTSEIKNLITSLPDSYIKYLMNDVSNSHSKNKKSLGSVTENGATTFLTIEDEIKDLRNSVEPLIYKFLTEIYPHDIKGTKLEFEKILSQKAKNDVAVVLVNLHSNYNKTHNRELFFFLRKEGQTWKIFNITEFVFNDNYPN